MDNLGRTWAQIDLGALAENFAAVKACCNKKMLAVVKADGYGHGAVPVAQRLAQCGADGFAVSNLAEAEELRAAGITQPILILGFTPPEFAAALHEHALSQCVYSEEYAQRLNAAAKERGIKVRCQLKLDTGMGRIGFDCRTEELRGLPGARAALLLDWLEFEGVFAHFAVADEPEQAAFTQGQYDRFCRAVDALEQTGHRFAWKHCDNSAAALLLPEKYTNAARCGIVLYGLAPGPELSLPVKLQPVMTLRSVVSMVKTVSPGGSVSYGRTYVAADKRVIATVSAGYADGVPRLISGKGFVLIRGQRAPIAGRVCMDQFCVDVTDIADVKMGDVVTIFGPELPVEEVATAAETISYEVICGVSKRVPRIYK